LAIAIRAVTVLGVVLITLLFTARARNALANELSVRITKLGSEDMNYE
jgi:hypothetical protein